MKKIPDNVRTSLIMILIGVVLVCVLYLPKRLEARENERFARPLFEHALPEGAYRVQNSVARDGGGGTTAAVILGTEWSEEELTAFYADTEYAPAHEGEQVILRAKPLDANSLSALKSAGKYREGDSYQFVYIYSSRPAE